MSEPLRVAVADDEPVMQMYLEEVIAEFGFDVVATAGDGAELVDLFHRTRPDLIVTDIKMPRVDGIEAVQRIYGERPVPVVFITGYSENHKIEAAQGSFVLVYLVKPVGGAELRSAIDEVILRFDLFTELVNHGTEVDEALAAYRRLRRAIAILAGQDGLDHHRARSTLRALAQERGQSLIETADTLLAQAPAAESDPPAADH